MKKTTTLLIAIFFLAGCSATSTDLFTIGFNGGVSESSNVRVCENYQSQVAEKRFMVRPTQELNPMNFTLLNWNSYKGSRGGWLENFHSLSKRADFVTLQEGHITTQLQNSLFTNDFTWDLAAAFYYHNIPTGVLTASKIGPSTLCSFRNNEPILPVPKTVIATRYPVAGSDESLLLINVHMINFTTGLVEYSDQLTNIEDIIANHTGPVILAGDFNTWSEERSALLERVAARQDLAPIVYEEDNRTIFFNHPVDHIYIKGLEQLGSEVILVDTSDHNPILATFRVIQKEHYAQLD